MTFVRHVVVLAVLVMLTVAAAWLERDHAVRAWPNEWAGYCVDQWAAPLPAEAAQLGLPDAGPRQQLTAHHAALAAGIARARSRNAQDLRQCVATLREAHWHSTAWQRLVTPDAPLHPEMAQADDLQLRRAADRAIKVLQRALDEDEHVLTTDLSDAVLRIYLRERQPRRDPAGNPQAGPSRLHPGGVVAAVRALIARQGRPVGPGERLGGSVLSIATGTLALWALLVLAGGATVWLLVLYPVWLAGGLVQAAWSLGNPAVRDVAVRHLVDWHGIWQPLWAALLGVLVARWLARDRWGSAWLLGMRSQRDVWARAGLILLLSALVWLLPGAARRSEAWMLLGCLALALFAARNAMLIGITGRPTAFGWPLVMVAGTGTLVIVLLRGDLGSAVLVLGVLITWGLFFLPRLLVLGLLVSAAAVVVAWGNQLQNPGAHDVHLETLGPQSGPTTRAQVERLWEDARRLCQELGHTRLCESALVEISDRSDLYRSLALAQSGLRSSPLGHGLVDLPANAMAVARSADRVITQMQMDYAPAIFMATWGWPGLLLLALYVLVIAKLGSLMVAQVEAALHAPARSLLMATAGFFLMGDALRVLISLGGSTAALPLTGQPAVGIAHAPAASLAFFFFAGTAMALTAPRGRT